MKEFKNVLKRLQDEEVKLSSEKVELGMLDDVKNISNDLEKAWKEGQNVRAKALKEAQAKVNAEIKKLVKMSDDAWNLVNDFEKKADALGIDGSNISSVKAAKKEITKMRARIDELSKGFDQTLM